MIPSAFYCYDEYMAALVCICWMCIFTEAFGERAFVGSEEYCIVHGHVQASFIGDLNTYGSMWRLFLPPCTYSIINQPLKVSIECTIKSRC